MRDFGGAHYDSKEDLTWSDVMMANFEFVLKINAALCVEKVESHFDMNHDKLSRVYIASVII